MMVTFTIESSMNMVAVDEGSSNASTPNFNKEMVSNVIPQRGNGDRN